MQHQFFMVRRVQTTPEFSAELPKGPVCFRINQSNPDLAKMKMKDSTSTEIVADEIFSGTWYLVAIPGPEFVFTIPRTYIMFTNRWRG